MTSPNINVNISQKASKIEVLISCVALVIVLPAQKFHTTPLLFEIVCPVFLKALYNILWLFVSRFLGLVVK